MRTGNGRTTDFLNPLLFYLNFATAQKISASFISNFFLDLNLEMADALDEG
jgi:hypothetical protein